MISILCPTRLRQDALNRSLASLYEHADGGELEVLLAVDPDDPTDYGEYGCVLRFRHRHGYPRLHVYYNALATVAKGDWLLLWNDDCLMTTQGWNRIVEAHGDVIISPDTVHNPLCTFPIVPRRFVETLGHFSLNAHCDTWWQEIGEELGILMWPGIWIDHDRADITGHNHDEVFAGREYQTNAFTELRPRRMEDVEKLRAMLGVPS